MPGRFGQSSDIGGGGGVTQLPLASLIIPGGTLVWTPSMFGQTSSGGRVQSPEREIEVELVKAGVWLGQFPLTVSESAPELVPGRRSVKVALLRAATLPLTAARLLDVIVSASGSLELLTVQEMMYSPVCVSQFAEPDVEKLHALATSGSASASTAASVTAHLVKVLPSPNSLFDASRRYCSQREGCFLPESPRARPSFLR